MKKLVLLLSIICLFVIVGCGQEEEAERPVRDDSRETAVMEETDRTETTEEKADETAGDVKEESGETAEIAEETAGDADGGAAEKEAEAESGDVAGVITMKNENAFPQHRMGVVDFDHEKHAADEPDGYGIGCGECHHDENGEPLRNLEPGDEVLSCYQCHDKDGVPRRDPSLSSEEWEKEQREYYYGAIHENCTECHKEMGGPVSCAECHPRPQQ